MKTLETCYKMSYIGHICQKMWPQILNFKLKTAYRCLTYISSVKTGNTCDVRDRASDGRTVDEDTSYQLNRLR